MAASKSKKKQQQKSTTTVTGKDGTQWLVDEAGNKVKKVRKKIRRNRGEANENDPSESYNSSSEYFDDKTVNTSSGTMVTEGSSSHSVEPLKTPSQKTPKKLKSMRNGTPKKKNLKEINGEMWRCDELGSPVSKVRKKSSRKDGSRKDGLDSKSGHSRSGHSVRMISKSDHGPSTSSKQTSKRKMKKKDPASMSVRNISNSERSPHGSAGYTNGTDESLVALTSSRSKASESLRELTSSSNARSKSKSRPKPQRLNSVPILSMNNSMPDGLSLNAAESFGRPKPPNRTGSGDLDMLMSQSVHDHRRKPVVVDQRPKMGKQRSTLGKILKGTKRLVVKKDKDKEVIKEFFQVSPSSRELQTDGTSKSDGNLTMSAINDDGGNITSKSDGNFNFDESMRSRSSKDEASIRSRNSTKPPPSDIREVNGALWRVDEDGNLLNKVRKKNKSHGNVTGSSGDEMSLPSPSGRNNAGWNSASSGDDEPETEYDNAVQRAMEQSFVLDSNSSVRNRRMGKTQRRNSLQANHYHMSSSNMSMNMSSANMTEGSNNEDSCYFDRSPNPHKKRSQSMDRMMKPQSMRKNMKQLSPTPSQKSKVSVNGGGGGDPKVNPHVVQNLQHRLRAAEKEIARLCKVTNNHKETIQEKKADIKKQQTKLKSANKDKYGLEFEVDRLEHELERKNDLILELRSRQRSANDLNKGSDGNSCGDHLVTKIGELEQEKESLLAKMETQEARSRSRLVAKEDEVRFLQEELERMRAEQGDRHFEYMKKIAAVNAGNHNSSGQDDDGNDMLDRSSRNGGAKSFAAKILGNHLKDKAETEVALQKQEIKDLQDRVCGLQMSNEKLKGELRVATLSIKDDDDDEIRRAKEMAATAAMCTKPKSMMNLPQTLLMQRSTSEGDYGSVGPKGPQSFRKMSRRGSSDGSVISGFFNRDR